MSKLPQTNFYKDIQSILEKARRKVATSVNSAMIEAYWHIGRMIVEEEQKGKAKAIYGEKLLQNLSNQLNQDFGKGFSLSNLKYFRKFYLLFPKGHAVRDQLSWTHYRLLLKVENERARTFYQSEAAAQQWSTRALERQINSFYYERTLANKNKARTFSTIFALGIISWPDRQVSVIHSPVKSFLKSKMSSMTACAWKPINSGPSWWNS